MEENFTRRITKRKRPPLEVILKFYDVWLREQSNIKAAKALGIGYQTLTKWIERYPEFKMAQKMATENAGNRENLAEYIIGHLSEESQALWNKLQFWDSHRGMDNKIYELMKSRPIKVKQELYLHALMRTNFDHSAALRITGTNRRITEEWKRDPVFQGLCKEIHWHKKNFFENALLTLVEEKHPGAVIFVNKTINADRGYSEKLEVKHSGTVDINALNIDDLDLPLETRRTILDAIRRKKEKALPDSSVVDVEEVKMLEAPEEREEVAA